VTTTLLSLYVICLLSFTPIFSQPEDFRRDADGLVEVCWRSLETEAIQSQSMHL